LLRFYYSILSDGFISAGLCIETIKFLINKINSTPRGLLSEIIKSVEIKDSLNFRIKLNRPFAPFIYLLASPYHLLIYSEKSKNQEDSSYRPIGTGPFILDNIVSGKYILLKKFSKYWKNHKNIDYNINFVMGMKHSEYEQRLMKGEIDILSFIAGHQIDRLRWQGKINYCVQDPINVVFLGFNNKKAPFNNLKVRKAMIHALDLKRIVFNLNRGNAIIARSPLPPVFRISPHSENTLYNPNLAKDLLNDAGIRVPLSLRFFFPEPAFTRQTLVEILKTRFEKLNINLKVTEYDSWEEHDQSIKSDSSQMFIDTYSAEILGDAGNFLFSMFHSSSDKNTLNYENPIVDSLLQKAISEKDADLRNNIYNEIVRTITEDSPAIFMFHVKPHYAFRTEKINNLIVDPYGIIQFHKLELN